MKKNKIVITFSVIVIIIICIILTNLKSNTNIQSKNNYTIDIANTDNNFENITKFKPKLKLDNKTINLNNELFISNDIVYAELQDICNTFNIQLTYDPELNYEISLEKYESILELQIDTPSTIKRIPGGLGDDYLNGVTFVKDYKIYVSLYEILKFFHYSINYDEIENSVSISNNDNRAVISSDDIYANAINSYLDLGHSEIKSNYTYNFNYSQHLKAYLNLTSSPKYKFALHDYTYDGVPELLLYYQNQESNENRGVSGWLIYQYNNTTNMLERLKISSENNYLSYIFGYDMENRLYTIIYEKDKIFTQCYEWDNNKGFALIDRKDGVIDDCVIRFDGIDSEFIKKRNINVKDVITSKFAEESVVNNLKLYVDDKEISFDENFPVQKKGTILLPTKETFTAIGYKISWLEKGEPIKLKVGNSNAGLLLTKGENLIFIPQYGYGEKLTINKSTEITPEITPQNINGNSYLSIAAISKSANVKAEYDKEKNAVYISTKN